PGRRNKPKFDEVWRIKHPLECSPWQAQVSHWSSSRELRVRCYRENSSSVESPDASLSKVKGEPNLRSKAQREEAPRLQSRGARKGL
ncbi:hypothetical protein HAX54_039863, partial [Datura stramonium]|nr:hypothetical protein [Datura stramonium]